MRFEKLKKRWALEHKARRARAKVLKRLLLENGGPVFEKFGIRKVILFGSVADGLSHKRSDLDVLVIPLPNQKYWEFRHELEEAVGIPIDLYTENDASCFVEKILSRGETVYEV